MPCFKLIKKGQYFQDSQYWKFDPNHCYLKTGNFKYLDMETGEEKDVRDKYNEEDISGEWSYRFSERLKSFMYLSEDVRFLDALGGARLCGIIIEEGVTKVTHNDFEYFLGRLWADPPSVMLMSKEQADMLTETCHNILRRERIAYGEHDVQDVERWLVTMRLRITTHR